MAPFAGVAVHSAHQEPSYSSCKASSLHSSSSCATDAYVEQQRSMLKAQLKSLLTQHDGSTKHPEVEHCIAELAELNPCHGESVLDSPHFLGHYTALTSPNFPGRLQDTKEQEHVVQYTLGRLSFNIFQPNKLVCTLRSVRNPVHVSTNEDIKARHPGITVYTYPLILDITIHTPDGDLDACLQNEAYCFENGNDETPNRLSVLFSGGTLLPTEQVTKDDAKLALWKETFEGAYHKAETERSMAGQMLQFLMNAMMGLTLPTDATTMNEEEARMEHSFHFEMKRSPAGYLDVLYLDEDLRITRGNRGTLVVVERSNNSM
jgi:hypothetical protein